MERTSLAMQLTVMKWIFLHIFQTEKHVGNCVYLLNKHSALQTNLTPNDVKLTCRLEFIKAFNTRN